MLLMPDNHDSPTSTLVQYLQAPGAAVRVGRGDALTVAGF